MIKGCKICGVKDSDTLDYIINHSHPPKFIGFICNYPKSSRYVEFNSLNKLLNVKKNKSEFVAVLVKPNYKILEEIKSNYQYIVIDCPPSLNILTVNALAVSDYVIIPTQCEYYALEGLTALLETIDKIKVSVNEGLKIGGILRTMYDPRNNLSEDVSDQLKKHFKEKIYKTKIPRNITLAESPSHGLPVLQYDSHSKGSISYMSLAGEILKQENS